MSKSINIEHIQNHLSAKFKEMGLQFSEDQTILEQVDSLLVVSILDLIETEFNIDFESFEVHSENFRSIHTLSVVIQRKINSKEPRLV